MTQTPTPTPTPLNEVVTAAIKLLLFDDALWLRIFSGLVMQTFLEMQCSLLRTPGNIPAIKQCKDLLQDLPGSSVKCAQSLLAEVKRIEGK